MNKNKSTLIIKILIILFIVILLIVAGLIVYLSTDLFKSNKTLFIKNASQILGKENSFIEDNVINHYEKIMQTPFQNESTLSFNITGGDAQQAQRVSQTNVTSNGQIDIKNKSFDENLSINYSPEVTLPYELRMKNGLFGYKQEQYISSKFIVDDRNSTSTSNNNNNTAQNITTEDIKAIFEKYIEIIFSSLTDDKFSKEESDSNTIYKLTLTNTDLINIEKSVLQTLKDDSETLGKLGLDASEIESTLNDIENESQENSDKTTEINLYKQNENLTKIEFINENINVSLEKTVENNNLQYKILLGNEKGNLVKIDLSYSGLASQEEEANIVLQLNSQNSSSSSSASNISYTLNNKVSFLDSCNIEDFNDDNALIFSKYDQEQIDSLTDSINDRMTLVNEMQMQQLGIDVSQNPLGIMTMPLAIFIVGQAATTVDNTALQQADVTAYNQKFELYEGTNIQGTTVRGLLTTISNNNGLQDSSSQSSSTNMNFSNSYKIEEINFNGEEYEVNQQNIAALKDEVVAENYYRVEFEKDLNSGRIYRAVINQK